MQRANQGGNQMQNEKAPIEYHIDYINKKMHFMDWSQAVTEQLVNIISPDYQKRFIEANALMQDVMDFEWIIYGVDGLIASYKNYNFKILNPKLPYLHKPYKIICESRKNRR
ncbi:MAG: hypothetical protein ACJ704_08560 [Nitrososphaeraceae archaeon]